MSWRMPAMCDNCPFQTNGRAIELAPGRFDGIKSAVLCGQPFHCHKTVHPRIFNTAPIEDWKECAGALAFRQDAGVEGAQRAWTELLKELS